MPFQNLLAMYNSRIAGMGYYIPEKVVTNNDLSQYMDTSDEWIQERTGIQERRYATKHKETTTTMAAIATKRAAADAGIELNEIDFIVFATLSPDYFFPGCGVLLQRELGITKTEIGAVDIRNQCSGFVYGLSIADQFVKTGMYKNVLVVGSEMHSMGLDFNTRGRNVTVIFGDGAGAVVLGSSQEGYIVSQLQANGNGTGMTGFILSLDKRFVMRGKEVWDQAIKVLPPSIIDVLAEAELKVEDLAMLVPHQPSINILKVVAKEVGLPMNKVKTVMDRYANIAGASIPIALEDAISKGEIQIGDKVMLTAIGSGWTWGSVLLNYQK